MDKEKKRERERHLDRDIDSLRERNNEEKEIRRERDTETQREREKIAYQAISSEGQGWKGGGGVQNKKRVFKTEGIPFFYLRGILRYSFNAIVSAIYRDIRLTCPRLLCLTLSSFHDFTDWTDFTDEHSRSLFCLIQPMTQATPIHNRL